MASERVLAEERRGAGRYVYRARADDTLDRSATARRAVGTRLASVLADAFLPVGYPGSVQPEYLRFQAYDTVQAACSYLRNILTTSAILRGAGVGEGAASPMAAAVAWVLRDGFGLTGSLLFSWGVGAGFDANVKEWRLFADVINDVGLTLDMLAPLTGSPSAFAATAALGALCKSICGESARDSPRPRAPRLRARSPLPREITARGAAATHASDLGTVAGATRASITAHFAKGGNNLADVSAKEGAQETAVTLLGLLVGSMAARHVGDSLLGTPPAEIRGTLPIQPFKLWQARGCTSRCSPPSTCTPTGAASAASRCARSTPNAPSLSALTGRRRGRRALPPGSSTAEPSHLD